MFKKSKNAPRLSNHKTRNVLQEQQRNLPLPTELHEVSSFLRLGQIGDAGDAADWDAPGIHSPNTNRLSGCYRFTKEDTIVGHDSSAFLLKNSSGCLELLSPSKKQPRSKFAQSLRLISSYSATEYPTG